MFRKYLSFIGLCLGFFVIMMDTTNVPLTYTTLMNVFHLGPAMIAWVNNIYLITYAAFLLLGGRFGDLMDRKSVVLVACLIIGIGAAISGAGQTFTEVLIGRAVMGAGAGLLTPQSMAFISILFTDGNRGTALGIWGTVAGIATAMGPVLTQVFLTTASWRWVMWVNIPFILACFILAVNNLPKDPKRDIKLGDTLVSGLFGLCLAGAISGIQLIGINQSVVGIGGIFILVGAIVLFFLIRQDIWQQHGYLLSHKLWVNIAFLKICFISGLLGLGLTGFYLPLAFLLDVRMNFGPVEISSVMIIIALANVIIGPIAGNLSDRVRPEKLVRLGLCLFAFANVLLGMVGVLIPSGVLGFVIFCIIMAIAGSGTGFAFAPLANLALGHASLEHVGRAAAFYNSVRQVFSALGGVIVAVIFDSIVRLQLGSRVEVTTQIQHQASHGIAIAAFVCFMVLAAGLILAAYLSSHREAFVEK